jgi:hypothetical protein
MHNEVPDDLSSRPCRDAAAFKGLCQACLSRPRTGRAQNPALWRDGLPVGWTDG